MNTNAVVAIVMGVVLMVLSFVLYPTLNNAMDDLYLYWVDSCELNNERFVRAYVGTTTVGASPDNIYITSGDDKGDFYGSGGTVTVDGATCDVSSSFTATGPTFSTDSALTLYSERGKQIATIAAGNHDTAGVVASSTQLDSDAKWIAVPSLLDQFGGIGRLVLSVMPIMVLASFLGLVSMGLVQYGRGMASGGIAGAVGAAIIQLIVVIVLLEVLPTVIDAMVDANSSATGGSLTVNEQFSGIMGIIFAALPLLLVVGILGVSGFMLFQKVRDFKGSGGFSRG